MATYEFHHCFYDMTSLGKDDAHSRPHGFLCLPDIVSLIVGWPS